MVLTPRGLAQSHRLSSDWQQHVGFRHLLSSLVSNNKYVSKWLTVTALKFNCEVFYNRCLQRGFSVVLCDLTWDTGLTDHYAKIMFPQGLQLWLLKLTSLPTGLPITFYGESLINRKQKVQINAFKNCSKSLVTTSDCFFSHSTVKNRSAWYRL